MKIKLDINGLIPVICQDSTTNQVLMLGWGNIESINKTIESKKCGFIAVVEMNYG